MLDLKPYISSLKWYLYFAFRLFPCFQIRKLNINPHKYDLSLYGFFIIVLLYNKPLLMPSFKLPCRL